MQSSLPDVLADLQTRMLVEQHSGGERLREHLTAEPRTLYCGFDPTAGSLHVGHLLPLLTLRRFQEAGHQPLVLLGGGTALIGDPSFRDAERPLSSRETVAANSAALAAQLGRLLQGAEIIDNAEWLAERSFLDFMRDVGRHFSVNAMVRKESVRQRLERDEQGISFTEFAYMLLQAFDFAHLHRTRDCTLQIGGSDQWGNITSGIDLVRRLQAAEGESAGAPGEVYGLTLPLVTRADGGKFGKTEEGAVWLDAERTSPYTFYQFWINTRDGDVCRYLRYFSALSPQDIEALEGRTADDAGRREAQEFLARELTAWVHGEQSVAAAERIARALFSGNAVELGEDDLAQLALDGLPSISLQGAEQSLREVLVTSGLARTPRGQVTLGQARKFMLEGAISVNGRKEREENAVLRRSEALFNRYHILCRGKKHYCLLCWEN